MIGEVLEAIAEMGSADFGDRAVFIAMLAAFLTWPASFLADVIRSWFP